MFPSQSRTRHPTKNNARITPAAISPKQLPTAPTLSIAGAVVLTEAHKPAHLLVQFSEFNNQ